MSDSTKEDLESQTQMKIYKYQLLPDETFLDLPTGAQFLTVQIQYGSPQAWFIVPSISTTERRKFRVICTGESFSMESRKYLGTYQMNEGNFVGHVFEELEWN